MHGITTTPKFEHVFGGEGALVKCDFPSIGSHPVKGGWGALRINHESTIGFAVVKFAQ